MRAPLFPSNWFDLAGDEGGGMGGGVGRWPMEGARGGDGGGTREQAVWEAALVPLLRSLKNLSTGLTWLVTRVGGYGEAWGGGMEGGQGGRWGGAPETSAKGALVPGSLKT